jgi:uncharacterized SAM-binding protein YcdF (DUF218 family)
LFHHADNILLIRNALVMMINPFPSRSTMTALSGLIGSGCMIFGVPCLPPISTNPPSPREPQAILVLGGSPTREKFAAQFALQHPRLPIFVSSGSPEEYAEYVFDRAGVERKRIHLDYRAVDTVTNFTIMVTELQQRKITDVYVLTSDFHMPRALVIGKIVLGSRGIEMHPVTIPSSIKSENPAKALRDGLRSVFWVVTGS